MRRKRRSFSAEFKAQRVLEVLSGIKTQAEVCREHQLQPHLFAQWKTTFLERAPTLFQTEEHRTQEALRIAELERLVGQQALELEVLKKGSSILTSLRGRSEP
jgi:transposase-like protein